jgi:hypothetical protein
MRIREFAPDDEAALRALHRAQGFDYEFPDLRDPLFVTKLVLLDAGKGSEETIAAAALLRLTAEAYLLLDPREGTPRRRWQRLLALHGATAEDAWQKGLSDVHAWLPPEISRRFGRRLASLGWIRDDRWTPYCKRLEDGRQRSEVVGGPRAKAIL